MGKYRKKKPVIIQAIQLTWKNWNTLCDFVGDIVSDTNPGRSVETFSDMCGEQGPWIELTIPTMEGPMIARHGDWIIRGIRGKLYPCKPDIFEATYEAADKEELKNG